MENKVTFFENKVKLQLALLITIIMKITIRSKKRPRKCQEFCLPRCVTSMFKILIPKINNQSKQWRRRPLQRQIYYRHKRTTVGQHQCKHYVTECQQNPVRTGKSITRPKMVYMIDAGWCPFIPPLPWKENAFSDSANYEWIE